MLKKIALVLAGVATVFAVALPANARTVHHAVAHKTPAASGQVCPGNVPGVAQAGVLNMWTSHAFNPVTGGYYVSQTENVTFCVPAGWQVLSENALPGNPTYGVKLTDVPWPSFTYDAWGASTPHARPSWVRL
jgi:hypothetical protein